MARIRTVKPEMSGHPSIAKLSYAARWLFVCLITDADDEGRFMASAKRIAGQLFPLDNDADSPQVEAWLVEIEHVGLIRRYEHDGGKYGQLVSWKDHQKISKPSPSRFPEPPRNSQGNPGDSREVPEPPGETQADLGPRTVDRVPTTDACEQVAIAILEGLGFRLAEVTRVEMDEARESAKELGAVDPNEAHRRCARWSVVFSVAPSIRAVPRKWSVLAPPEVVAPKPPRQLETPAKAAAMSDAVLRARDLSVTWDDWRDELDGRDGLLGSDRRDALERFENGRRFTAAGKASA